jgi:hypothetical protein
MLGAVCFMPVSFVIYVSAAVALPPRPQCNCGANRKSIRDLL